MIARRANSRIRMVQTALVCLMFAAFSALAIAAVLSGSLRRYRPDMALNFRPADAVAKARLASLIEEGSGFSAAHGVDAQLAREALVRDPTAAVAARVIGMDQSTAGDDKAAARSMAYANSLTRRDLATQVWLIDYYVRRGDDAKMLEHFEAAASTSRGAMSVLFPILVTVMNDPNMVHPVADLLSREPWWAASLIRAMAEGNASTANTGRLFIELAERGHPPRAELAGLVVRRLDAEGMAPEARQLARLTGVATGPGQ